MPTLGFAWSTRILGFITLGELIIALAIMLPYTKRAERKADEATSFSEIFLDKTAFKDPAFLALSMAFFFMWIGYWAVSFFIPTFGEYKVKASAIRSSDFLVISNAVSLGGRLLAVVTSNKFGVPETVPWFALASGVLLLGWIGIESIPSFEAWIVLSSLFMSPLAVLCPSMLAHVSPWVFPVS
jgi:Na+/melibiose symporter-like transporter